MPDHSPLLSRKFIALPVAVSCCLLWGSAFPTVKAGLEFLTPTFFAASRFTIAGLALLITAALGRADFSILAVRWREIMLIGVLQTIVGYFLFFHGMAVSQAVTGSIIVSSGPIMVALLAYPLLGEGDWSAPQMAGVFLGFAGVFTALIKPGWQPDFTLRGEGLIVLSTFSMSLASIVAKRIAESVDAILISGGSMTFGGLFLLATAMFFEPPSEQVLTLPAVLLLIYAAFVSAAAFTLWYALLRHNLVSRISTIKFLIPIFGATLSAFFLGEELTLFKAGGGLMVGAGIYLIFLKKEERMEGFGTAP